MAKQIQNVQLANGTVGAILSWPSATSRPRNRYMDKDEYDPTGLSAAQTNCSFGPPKPNVSVAWGRAFMDSVLGIRSVKMCDQH